MAIRDIENRLGIPKSTLSGWLRGIRLSAFHGDRLRKRADRGLVRARIVALKWHNHEREKRQEVARKLAMESLDRIDTRQIEITELALAMLYLGEGSKKNLGTSMGNSNAAIMRFFVASIHALYDVPTSDFRCYLHLRADQDPDVLRSYWAQALGLPEANFGKPLIDKRTKGKPTYPDYKGVCTVSCGRVAIQRKLMYIADIFCDRIQDTLRG